MLKGLSGDLTKRRDEVGWFHQTLKLAHPFGQFSDDTQFARELALACIETKSLSEADAIADRFAARIAKLYSDHKVVGCGMGTAQALTRLIKGADSKSSGSAAGSAGNRPSLGGVIVGLIACNLPLPTLVQLARRQAIVTHQDKRSQAGAIVMAVAVRELMKLGRPMLPQSIAAIIKTIVDSIRELSPPFAKAVERLPKWLKLSPSKAVVEISRAGLAENFDDGSKGVSGFVISSTLWPLYCFLRSPDNFWQIIEATIAGGGDTDSTAALAGALAGAHLGLNAIPSLFLQLVQDDGKLYKDELTQIAVSLLNLSDLRNYTPPRAGNNGGTVAELSPAYSSTDSAGDSKDSSDKPTKTADKV